MQERSGFETVLVNGNFNFIGNVESNFRGPIKKGFRPIVWCRSINQATSCSFVSDVEIKEGQSKVVNIVILNELVLGCEIKEGLILNIGSTVHKIGEFIVIKDLGKWEEQVP
jgi:hypothetical protein